jgi:arginyl-tRNA synthetase
LVIKALDPDWIRIGIQPKMLDPDELNADPQPCRIGGAAAEQAAERLGISALVVNDLRHRRVQDYKFSWSKALNPRYEYGFHLLFT